MHPTSRSSARYDVIRFWCLPSSFFSLSPADQRAALVRATSPAVPKPHPSPPCHLSLGDDLLAVAFFLVTLGLPFLLGALFARRAWQRDGVGLVRLAAFSAFLALHPLPRHLRRSRLALALARYFTMEMLVDRSDPRAAAAGTAAADDPAFQKEHLPAVYLACPHGVFNYGAIVWCCVSRYVVGWEQHTGAAAAVRFVPGLRYMGALVWPIDADRAHIQQMLRARGPGRQGGMLGMVPDGILGAFRTRAGRDELLIGKRRGLLRICIEEGAAVNAAWFFGTNELLTVVQDPWGGMEFLSRKMQAGIMGYYGRWGLPVPRRVPLTVVVASHKCEKKTNPSVEEVEETHRQVYGGLQKVFDEQKIYAGYPDRTLLIK